MADQAEPEVVRRAREALLAECLAVIEPFAKHAESAMLLDLLTPETRSNLNAAAALPTPS